ncbi:hypothetical protein [uncultured Fibrobacter sp.]|uniref:hypothetical protein n=1 Tax=uncultured Fibrobacter sp. TaxID=261512 RepID=UPI0025F0F58A|nr:hypothetical protein [uncultured Fibrobacter sp.]
MSLTLNDIKHSKIKAWVEECIAMCEPDNVVVVDGSKEEYDALNLIGALYEPRKN